MQRLGILQPGSGIRRLLLLGAHADDIEIGCGGTMLMLLERLPGTTVHWVVFSATNRRMIERISCPSGS